MSRIGQAVQQLQEGQPEPMEPDPLYDERRDWEDQINSDPGYFDFLMKELTNARKVKW
jgi:hypothetical protein